MFMHNKKLQYTVRVSETNPKLAVAMLEQFGGPQGELAAALRYFTQGIAETDPGRKDMLLDIATEELSHLEIIGSIICMLNRNVKGAVAEGVDGDAEMYHSIGNGGETLLGSVLYGGGVGIVNSGGQTWSAAYVDSIGEPTADLRSNIAAEARAKIIYERLINLTDDKGVKDALGFLMTREISHQKSFEKALYAIESNFPPGKLPGVKPFDSVYVNASHGDDVIGPWNSDENFKRIDDFESMPAADGGDGTASVTLSNKEATNLESAAQRTKSRTNINPTTGAELGSAQSR